MPKKNKIAGWVGGYFSNNFAFFAVSLISLIAVAFVSPASAMVTLSGTAITGDNAFTTLATVVPTTIDAGSGNTLSLQTANNGPITAGTGLFTITGSLSVTGHTTLSSASTTGNLTVLGSIFDASGNKYVTSTAGGGITAIDSLSNSTTSIVGAGTVTVSTSSPNTITITGSGGSGGSLGTSSAITANNFPFWTASVGTLSGTSTLTLSGTTLTQANAFLIGGSLNVTGTVSLASTTINGNATTTGSLAVLGSIFDASGNKYVTSTAGGGITAIDSLSNSTTSIIAGANVTVTTSSPNTITIAASGGGWGNPTINGITSSTFNFLAAGSGLAVASSASPNNITYTWTNPGFPSTASSVTWTGAQTFAATSTFASTTVFSNIATSSLLYTTSTGQLVPLSLGTNLSISGGALNAAGGGGGGGNVNASGTFALNAPVLGAANGTTTLVSATTSYTNITAAAGGLSYQSYLDCRDTVFNVTTTFNTSTSTSQTVAMFTAPPYWIAKDFTIEETQTVTSGTSTITGMSATVVGTAGTAFTTPFLLMGSSSPAFADYDGGSFSTAASASSTQVVSLRLAVTNVNPGNLSGLSGGVITVRTCGVTLQ